MATYKSFTDKYGNKYGFDNYIEFANFWFGLSRKNALSIFPDNFKELQNEASNSKEARTKANF